eukprot:937520-Pleurochrysis_carterae.AAC.1
MGAATARRLPPAVLPVGAERRKHPRRAESAETIVRAYVAAPQGARTQTNGIRNTGSSPTFASRRARSPNPLCHDR